MLTSKQSFKNTIIKIKEETNLKSDLKTVKYLTKITHEFENDINIIKKETYYYLFEALDDNELEFGTKPKATKELVWVNKSSPRLKEIKFPNILELVLNCFEL